jgi:hypothetical protein
MGSVPICRTINPDAVFGDVVVAVHLLDAPAQRGARDNPVEHFHALRAGRSLLEPLANTRAYYGHERLWARMNPGQSPTTGRAFALRTQ